jgi:site-specific DNA-methyltransferase (adenine-specific)
MAELTPYYERDGITIYCGDCLEVMPHLDLVFDGVFCDLPYGTTECNWDVIIPFKPLWENYKRLVKGNGAVVLTATEPFTSFLIISNITWFRHRWIWEKDKAANFLHAPYMPIATCEDVIIFNSEGYAVSNKNKPTYNPQKIRVATLKSRNTSKSTNEFSLRKIVQRKKPTPMLSDERYNGWERYPKAKIYFPVDYGKNRFHPTQKPIDLMAYLIRTYTNPGEIILDNTMGSGTTLVAAQQEGRRAVGIELDEDYCKIAVERLRQPSFFSVPDKPKTKPAKQLEMMV